MKKSLFLLMGLLFISTLFFSCLEEEEEDEEDDYYLPNTSITKCDAGQTNAIRKDEFVLGIEDWPAEIRSFTATELSGYSIAELSRFSTESNTIYYLATMNNDGALLFDNSKVFVCADGEF